MIDMMIGREKVKEAHEGNQGDEESRCDEGRGGKWRGGKGQRGKNKHVNGT